MSESEPIVTTRNGNLKGKVSTNYKDGPFYSFLGIPYGAPPIEKLRFKAPLPAQPWNGTRDATAYGSDCFQRHVLFKTFDGSEDCLYLNVYTPEVPKKNDKNPKLRPVLVWIHGGGFTSGSGAGDIYGPDYLLTKDVVLVTINYRLWVLGFLSLDDPKLGVSGNAGLKDQVLALKWVQDNIKNFGGNPQNVTIFGESAGAASVHYLLLSPRTKGLFHRAVLLSGCALNVWAKSRKITGELANLLNLKSPSEGELLNTLQNLPVETFYETCEKLPDEFLIDRIRPFGPVIENRNSPDALIWEDPIEIIKSGRYNQVPIMMGFTSAEGMLGEVLAKPKVFKLITDFEFAVPVFLNLNKGSDASKTVAREVKKFYYGNEEPGYHNKQHYYNLQTDNFFLREILQSSKLHLNSTRFPIYFYRFSIETNLNFMRVVYDIPETNLGACHGDDLGYLFKNVVSPDIEPGSKEDVAVNRLLTLLTNFALTGNPNSSQGSSSIGVEWKPISTKQFNYLDFGEKLTVGVDPEKERMKFWDGIVKINPAHKL